MRDREHRQQRADEDGHRGDGKADTPNGWYAHMAVVRPQRFNF
jgi:hypothetical protein